MAKGSDNPFPSVLLVEGSSPAAPSSGDQRLFIDTADHLLKAINSAGTVIDITAGGAGSTTASAQQSTATSIPNGSYGKMQLDGSTVLHGGATIDNTGMTGNGIKPGAAGTYLIIGTVGSIANVGAWFQIGWAKNGTTEAITTVAGSSGQSGGTIVDIATLTATDVVNLVAQAATSQNSYANSTRLMVIRLY